MREFQPFADADVLFRFEPSEEERCYYDEYVVVTVTVDRSPALLYARYGKEWDRLDFPRPLIAHLLKDLDALGAYIGSPGGPSYEELVKENDRLAAERDALIQQRDYEWERRKQATSARQKAEAERDIYREELTKLKARGFTWEVISVLEQGAKVREGK